MSLESNFCSSPWFHVKISSSGEFFPCRWSEQKSGKNINQTDPLVFFQKDMHGLRESLLEGQRLSACSQCHDMEDHGKVSGRQRQLLKTGIRVNEFAKTAKSSPYYQRFLTNDCSELYPKDWQIDLGNYCNSGCVFCVPESSSRLAAEFNRIGWLKQPIPDSWCNNRGSFNKFLDTLEKCPDIEYLHFIGGEPLIIPQFREILEFLHERKRFNTAIGFTTNLTVWDEKTASMLSSFRRVFVGGSIETMDTVNDYVRWPSQIESIKTVLDKWIQASTKANWYFTLRITPSALTISRLVQIFDFAIDNNVAVESCNFLEAPSFLKISVLPKKIRQQVSESMEEWVKQKSFANDGVVVNTHHPELAIQSVIQDAKSYIDYLKNCQDESHLLSDLSKYLKALDRSRNISVLDFLPEYENLLRSNGY